MPEYSGIAGVVPRAQPTEPPIGDSFMQLMQNIVALKSAKQQAAGKKLDTLMSMVGQGFPVDDKAFAKTLKAAGLGDVISTKPDDMAAAVATKQMQKQVASPDGVARAQMKASGNPDQLPGGGQKGQPMQPEQMRLSWVNQMAKRAREVMNLKAQSEEAKAQNTLLIENLRTRALNGDEEAAGRLIGANEWKFDISAKNWENMSPEQRKKSAAVAAGAESDSDKAKRGSLIGESLITSGRLTDPGMAYKAGQVLVEGGELPPEIKKAMKPFTFSELADQAKLANSLIEMGLPPNMVGKTLSAATAGGLENAIPTGLKPVVLQQLQLQKQQVGLEGARLGIEEKKFEAETLRMSKLDEMAKTQALKEEDKETLDMFRAALDAKKAGSPFPDGVMKGLYVKVAGIAGMDASEVSHWYNFFGGTELEFTPHLSDQGKSVVDRAIGQTPAPIKTPTPSSVSTISRAAKGVPEGSQRGTGEYQQGEGLIEPETPTQKAAREKREREAADERERARQERYGNF